MNYNAAHFRKEVLVRLTLRASYYEKILRSAFPPPPDAFSPKPSLAPSRIPAFALTSPWAGRQATLHEFAPQTAAGAFFRLRGGCTASPILQAEQMAEAALDACRIQNGRCKTGGISDEELQSRQFFYRRGCNSWRKSFVFQTKQLNSFFIIFSCVFWYCCAAARGQRHCPAAGTEGLRKGQKHNLH